VDYPSKYFGWKQRGDSYDGFGKAFPPAWRHTPVQMANLAAKYGIFQIFQGQDLTRLHAFLDFWGGSAAHHMRIHQAWRIKYNYGDFQQYEKDGTLFDPITDVLDDTKLHKDPEHLDRKSHCSFPSPSWFIAILNTLAAAVNKDAPLV